MRRILTAGMAVLVVAGLLGVPRAVAAPSPSPSPRAVTESAVQQGKRDELLGKGWQLSDDRVWTTSGDANGLHVLVADAKTGYAWRTAATLRQGPVGEVDQWIGNACATESGQRLVVVYAPRSFTNTGELFDRGGFTAVVDLNSGEVRDLPVRTSLAYFNPGCGTGERAVLTQAGDDDLGKTGLITLDAVNGSLGERVEVPGQLTSAVPTRDGIVGADRDAVVRVAADGQRTVLADTSGVPSRLTPDGSGGLVFMDLDGAADRTRVRRAVSTAGTTKPATTTLAHGSLGDLGVTAGSGRKVFITGAASRVESLPPVVAKLDVPEDAVVSTGGEAVVTKVLTSKNADPRLRAVDPDEAQPVSIEAKSTKTGKSLEFAVSPDTAPTPAVAERMSAQGSSIDVGYSCAVPRNDPATQVYQPKPKQVEWAADMAVNGKLMVQRPVNWHGNGLGAYKPQELFQPPPLKNTDNGKVPAQVLLGILGQESNLWQASRVVMPGEYGNPLIGNYYGNNIYNNDPDDDWNIDWDKADCGYGVSQMTDGMRKAGHEKPGETALPWQKQKAIATDYAANVAAGLQLLSGKWNLLQDRGVMLNTNNPAAIENWFLSAWAYNSGWHEPGEPDSAGAYGLGWLNNPANPKYAPERHDFGLRPDDFAHPNLWPYEEKVLGFAMYPPSGWEAPGVSVPFFRGAWWSTTSQRATARPQPGRFCTDADQCQWGKEFVPDYPGTGPDNTGDVRGEPAGPCGHLNGAFHDLKCWWHDSVVWKDCQNECGHEYIRYVYPDYEAEPDDGVSYPPQCGVVGLPSTARVVDDVPGGTPTIRVPGCAKTPNAGSFDLSFGINGQHQESAKIDLHQIGGGFGAHFWFSHTNKDDPFEYIRGTWTFGQTVTGWARVFVHVPDHGAQTRQSAYWIDLGNGEKRFRVLPQRIGTNKWVSLGAMPFNGTPKIWLSNQSDDGKSEEDIAWDAVAVAPLPGKPANIIASLGDSYSSGEGASVSGGGDYYPETDVDGLTAITPKFADWRDACHRSTKAWSRMMRLGDSATPIGQRADALDPTVDHRLVACSSARTSAILSKDGPANAVGGKGEFVYHEVAQLDSGWVDADTTLVTLSIGGNDAEFVDVLKSCVVDNPLVPCQTSSLHPDKDSRPLKETEPELIQGKVRASVETVLRQIHAKAPNARIVLAGYPAHIISSSLCLSTGAILPGENEWLGEMGVLMNMQLQAAVNTVAAEGARIRFSDPTPDFDGKGVCGDPELIHGVVVTHTPGDPPNQPVSAQSFHPKIEGAQAYSNALTRTLGTF
ncbi:MAG: hypothetical protein ABIQ18_36700 [Umezawaea sp.]